MQAQGECKHKLATGFCYHWSLMWLKRIKHVIFTLLHIFDVQAFCSHNKQFLFSKVHRSKLCRIFEDADLANSVVELSAVIDGERDRRGVGLKPTRAILFCSW